MYGPVVAEMYDRYVRYDRALFVVGRDHQRDRWEPPYPVESLGSLARWLNEAGPWRPVRS